MHSISMKFFCNYILLEIKERIVFTGVGKTTAIQKTLDLLIDKSIKFQGFFTEEVKHGRGRIGFDVVSTCGKRGELARIR